jgi:acid stress-induced BolA-like protein IbaG/YrbA
VSNHPTSFVGDVRVAIKTAVEAAIPGALCEATGGGGHFEIVVTSAAFADKTLLAKQRMVLSAVAHLMAGADAPVHAVDSIVTKLP